MGFEELKSVTLANGETMTYRVQGDGPQRLLLLHGNMTSSKHWDLVAEALGPGITLVAPDMRGFGGSTYHTPITSLKDLADDLKLFCDAIDFRDFTFVGWSTGGGVGMQFAIDHEGYASKVMLMASMSTRGYPFYENNEQGEPDLSRRITTKERIEVLDRNVTIQNAYDTKNRELLRAIWNAVIYTARQPEADRYEAYIEDMMTQRNLMDLYYSLNTFNISGINNEAANGTNGISSLKQPVVILYGDRDYVVPEPMTLELIEDIPHAQVIKLADCGHSPIVDQLDALVGHITSFVRS